MVIALAICKAVCKSDHGFSLGFGFNKVTHQDRKFIACSLLRVWLSLPTSYFVKLNITISRQVRPARLVLLRERLVPNGACLSLLLALLVGNIRLMIVWAPRMHAANKRWLLIYKQKLLGNQQGWIIYEAVACKVAFHTSFRVKCHMNSKQAKRSSRKRNLKIAGKREEREGFITW